MGIIATLVSALLLMASLASFRKRFFSPIFLFFLLWTMILALSTLGLYNLKLPSDEVYIMLMVMLIFFFVGSMGGGRVIFLFRKEVTVSSKEYIYQVRERLFWGGMIVYFLLALIDDFIVIREFVHGVPMWQIRNWRLSPYGSSNPLLSRRGFGEELLRSAVLEPFEVIVHPIAAYALFREDENKKRFLFASLLILLMSSIAGGGGRLGYIYVIGCYILSYFSVLGAMEKLAQKIKKYKTTIIFFAFWALVFVVFITSIRTADSIFKQTYIYFASPPSILNVWIEEMKTAKHTYGALTFFGVTDYLFRGLDKIGLTGLVPDSYYYSFEWILKAERFVDVGARKINAFVTPVYYMYIDGGYGFICFCSALFGFAVSKVYTRYTLNVNIRSFVFYALITYGVFLSFIRVQTCIAKYIISLFFVFFMFKKNKKQDF